MFLLILNGAARKRSCSINLRIGLNVVNVRIARVKGVAARCDDIKSNGRLNSNHRYYYDKVEKLLCWSVYYTACAMQYCYNEGKKENDDNTPNPNYFVGKPERDNSTENTPVSDPQSRMDDFLNLRPPIDGENRIARNFKNISKIFASIALAGIPDTIRKIMEVASGR